MNYHILTNIISFTLILGVPYARALDNPKALADNLSAAMSKKDMNAATKLVQWDKAPIAAHRLFKMSIADCFAPKLCKVEITSISDEEKKPQLDYQYSVIPEGQIKIIEADGNEGLHMPFAKINNEYKIILGQQTDQAFAQAKASTDALKIAQELDPDLVASGQKLEIDLTVEPSSSYFRYVEAITNGDTAFLAQSGTAGDRYFFGTAYQDNPVKKEVALELARMENIPKPTIKGGFIKDNKALLMVSGSNGQGWASEGVVQLILDAGKWSIEDKLFLSYEPGRT